MDPVTHFLFGANMARAGLNRKTALATLTLTLAAEAPDLDVVMNVFGGVEGFAHHRGLTHSFLGVPFLAALVLAGVYGIWRLMRRMGRDTKSPPRWKLLYAYALLGGLSHILLDFTNNYGVRPLSPFLHKWWSWDIVFIIEPVMALGLAAALVLPALFGLVGQEIGARRAAFRGRGAAIAALLLVAATWGYRHHQHELAIAMLESSLYEGQNAIRVSAYPYWVNPYKWFAVVETETFFQTMHVDTFSGDVDAEGRARIFYKPEETEVSLAAKRSRLGQVYLDWAAYPYVRVEPLSGPEGGYVVRFRDLRFAYPEREGTVLGAHVALDQNLRVTGQSTRDFDAHSPD